jgi:hypothetical protein
MKYRKQIYLLLGGSLVVALGLNYTTPWSMMILTGFTLAYASKGMRRSPKVRGEKSQKS